MSSRVREYLRTEDALRTLAMAIRRRQNVCLIMDGMSMRLASPHALGMLESGRMVVLAMQYRAGDQQRRGWRHYDVRSILGVHVLDDNAFYTSPTYAGARMKVVIAALDRSAAA